MPGWRPLSDVDRLCCIDDIVAIVHMTETERLRRSSSSTCSVGNLERVGMNGACLKVLVN